MVRDRAVGKVLTKSGDEAGDRASRLLIGCATIATARLALAVPTRRAPGTPFGFRESLNWMSRWRERDREARGRALRARDTGLRLSWSRDSQPCYRDPSRLSQLSGRHPRGDFSPGRRCRSA